MCVCVCVCACVFKTDTSGLSILFLIRSNFARVV